MKAKNNTIRIAREDLLLGGTKQRAIIPFLHELRSAGAEEVVYASPFCGFAQVALSVGARASGLKAVIYCERDPHQSGCQPHTFANLAKSYGAVVHLTENLAQAEAQAKVYAYQHPSRAKIPLGFHHERYVAHMREAISLQVSIIAEQYGGLPGRIWLPVGSGALASVFAEVIPKRCKLIGVNVGVLNCGDERIRMLTNNKHVQLMQAEETFHQKAKLVAPIPSNEHYDAKLWRLINDQGEEGDLWWNVAK